MKRCSICKLKKEEVEFNFRNKKRDTKFKHCRSCQKNIHDQSYRKNREFYIERGKARYRQNRDVLLEYAKRTNKKRRKRRRAFINQFKENKACLDCGIIYPSYVMEFDHLPQFKKSFTISHEGHRRSEKELLLEFAKCDLVCANCHRIRTWNRQENET